MSKSSPTPPAAPDPVATANAQTASNVNTAEAQAALNNVNQETPYGSVTYNQTGTGAGGVPTYTESTSLSPAGQQLFNSEGSLENSALGAAGGLASDINTNQISPTTTSSNNANTAVLNQTPQQLDQASTEAAYNEAAGFLAPQWNQQQTQLQDQLSRQGIPLGSDAYNNSETQFNNAQTQAYNAAADNAIQVGVGNAATMANTAANNASTLNNLSLADNSQNFNQQIAAQDQPVNLLSALISGGQATGQTAAPNSTPAQTSIAPTNTAAITQNSYQDALSNYQAQLAQQNNLFGGLASLGGNLGAAILA